MTKRDRYNPERWREVCAARMEKLLNRAPRKATTRAYVASLPKRGPVKVSPEEFSVIPPEQTDGKRLRAILASLSSLPPSKPVECIPYEPPVRADRVRPSKREAYDPTPLLQRIAAIQGWACVLCGGKLLFGDDLFVNDPNRASFEHAVPRSRGGGNVRNRLASHRDCNARKGNRMPNGCERIWLIVVNARLYSPRPPLLAEIDRLNQQVLG